MSNMQPLHFLSKNLRVEGFLLPYWLREKSAWSMLGISKQSKRLLEDVQIYKEYGLHQIHEAVEDYKQNMTKGKILLKPSLTP
jgi:hypothetical protein